METKQHQRPAGDEPASKKPKKVFELPTADEQKQLHQMAILMRSNLLSLQCKELITEVSAVKKFSSKRLTEWLATLHSDLVSTAKYTCVGREISGEWVEDTQKHYGLTLSHFDDEDNIPTITYQVPSAVETIGSYCTTSGTAPIYVIDVAVTMPAAMFTNRYAHSHSDCNSLTHCHSLSQRSIESLLF